MRSCRFARPNSLKWKPAFSRHVVMVGKVELDSTLPTVPTACRRSSPTLEMQTSQTLSDHMETRLEDATKQAEPVRHLRQNPHHHFNWKVITITHPLGIRRNLESLFIAKFQPCLNKQDHAWPTP